MKTAYLFGYNVAQFVGWSLIGFKIYSHFDAEGTPLGLFDAVKYWLYIFQSLALMEVVHAALGLVRSNPTVTFLQVWSRLFLVWGILWSVPNTQDNLGVLFLLSAWVPTEIIRYLFYAIGLVGYKNVVLLWCRYTFFYVLYPLGVTGELMTCLIALPYLKYQKMYSYHLPNKYNISFDYYYYTLLTMASYVPIFPMLYCHMIKQRNKFFGDDAEDEPVETKKYSNKNK